MYLRAARRSWRPQRGRCPCRLWRREVRTLRWTRFPPERQTKGQGQGAERTASPLRRPGTGSEPPGAARPRQRARREGRTGLAWKWSGCGPNRARTLLGDQKFKITLSF